MTNTVGQPNFPHDEAEEAVTRLMQDYNLDEDTAVRVQDIMQLRNCDADTAVTFVREQDQT